MPVSPYSHSKAAIVIMRGFDSTSDALGSLDACRSEGVASARLVSRPAAMGNAECGTALRTLPEDEGLVERALARAGIAATARLEMRDFV